MRAPLTDRIEYALRLRFCKLIQRKTCMRVSIANAAKKHFVTHDMPNRQTCLILAGSIETGER
jgi:hypothetical protein